MTRRYTYDLFEPSEDNERSLDRLSKEFAPLHMQAWEKAKRPNYNKPYDMNVGAFANMWLSHALKIFMAYEDGTKPVGFLTGFVYRPLPYNATVFQVEDWFTNNNKDVEDGLFDYLYEAMRMLGCTEMVMTLDNNAKARDIGPEWHLHNEFKTLRYVRGK